jgi:hypothetical protein
LSSSPHQAVWFFFFFAGPGGALLRKAVEGLYLAKVVHEVRCMYSVHTRKALALASCDVCTAKKPVSKSYSQHIYILYTSLSNFSIYNRLSIWPDLGLSPSLMTLIFSCQL